MKRESYSMTAEHLPPAELLPSSWEHLFPLPVADIMPVWERLEQVTDADVHSFISVRRDGRADDVLTALYNAGFADWHVAQDDFHSEMAVERYKCGKLYGGQLVLDQYQKLAGQPLRADDPDAYAAARFVVHGSYRGVSSEAGQWQRDVTREYRHTGGHVLALLNALLHDHTVAQFERVYEGKIPEGEALESFYTGLLDAAIFVDAYATYRDHNRLPTLFSEPKNPIDAAGLRELVTATLHDEQPAFMRVARERGAAGIAAVLRRLRLPSVKK